jgi:hypothetical protein
MSVSFRKNTPYTKRYADSLNMVGKHPNHIPIVLHYEGGELAKNKYLVPENMLYGSLLSHIRHAIGVSSYESLFLYAEKISLTDDSKTTHSLPALTERVADVRAQYGHKDGYLYLVAVKESTFG